MAWVRLDTGFTRHPKVLELTDKQFRAHVAAMCWVAENGTDGFIPKRALAAISEGCSRACSALVRAGVWDEADGGFRIHDWTDYNITREAAEARNQASRERLARWRARQKQGSGNAVSNGVPNTSETLSDTTRHDSPLRGESRGVARPPIEGGADHPRPAPLPTASADGTATARDQAEPELRSIAELAAESLPECVRIARGHHLRAIDGGKETA